MSTLTQIRTKVRRLTGRPSPQQITDAQIDEYVNTFYLYDMPETLRLFTQHVNYEFMTTPNVAEYDLSSEQAWTGQENVPVVDYYINLEPPAYVAGYQVGWSQSETQFKNIYPPLAQIDMTVEGDGTAGPYTVTFSNTPIMQNSVTVGAVDNTDVAETAKDVPTDRTNGTWQLINTNNSLTGSINYITGAVSVTFNNAISSGTTITFTAVPYTASRPQYILFYKNILTLRPIPDAEYLVSIAAYRRPTQLVDSGDYPQLRQWWQYLAFGAAKKIFEDSQDNQGVDSIMKAFKEQENLVLRRTIVQQTNQRSATIYTEFQGFPYGWGNFNN